MGGSVALMKAGLQCKFKVLIYICIVRSLQKSRPGLEDTVVFEAEDPLETGGVVFVDCQPRQIRISKLGQNTMMCTIWLRKALTLVNRKWLLPRNYAPMTFTSTLFLRFPSNSP